MISVLFQSPEGGHGTAAAVCTYTTLVNHDVNSSAHVQ